MLNEQGAPENIDFTAKIIFVGPPSFHGWSLWSIARVEQRFSDPPWSVAGLVVLRNFFHSTDTSERFFIEGRRSWGVFSRFLPVIERVECGHSGREDDAVVALRILRDGRPRTGVRIIGRVSTSWLDHPKPLQGIEVQIKGPTEAKFAVTDAQGVYDVTGLLSGQYTVELSGKGVHPVCALDLEKMAVNGCNLFLDEIRER